MQEKQTKTFNQIENNLDFLKAQQSDIEKRQLNNKEPVEELKKIYKELRDLKIGIEQITNITLS